MKIRRLPLAQQLSLLIFLATLLVFGALVMVLSALSRQSAIQAAESGIQERVQSLSASIGDSIDAALDVGKTGMEIYKRMLPGPVAMSDERVTAGGMTDVPLMKSGSVPLNNNLELLGKVRDLLGADPAVLVRVGDTFVRVTTFLKTRDGKSMVGTKIPADSPETKTTLAGKTYAGVTNREGSYYAIYYEPVKQDDKVVGLVTIRVSIENIMKRVEAGIKAIKVGETGYAFVIVPGKTVEETSFLVHPDSRYAGKTLAQIGDARLSALIGKMIEKKKGTMYYAWDGANGNTEEKLISLAELRGTNWIIGAGASVDELTADARRIRNIMIGILVGAAVILIGIAAFFTSRSLAPLGQMAETMAAMGSGDLRQEIAAADPESRDETARLAVALVRMRDGLISLVGGITTATGEMAGAAQRMNEMAHQVMEGSEQQSQSAASLAAAVEEVSVSITHVSDNAGEARTLVNEAAEAAQSGNRKMNGVVRDLNVIEGDMRETAGVVHQLGERTAEITNVIQIIKEIADQTNLLALNAAIEAARAGESGRGFAVVADEVRKLAERTAHSTAEISDTIVTVQTESADIVRRIEVLAQRITDGVSAADAAGESLNEIERGSLTVAAAVSDIAGSTGEQSAATHQIAQGVESIAQMADRNRRASQDNNEGAEHLRRLAEDLNKMVARFRA